MTEQKGGFARAVGALQIVAILAGLALLVGKGLGLGVNWLTILGVFAIPGVLGAISLVVMILVAVLLGLVQIFDNQ